MRAGARTDFGPPSHWSRSTPHLGFGGWSIGGSAWGTAPGEAERLAAVCRALERGITFYDTAPTYGDGASERLLGGALRSRRAAVAIATKVGPHDDPRASLEGSLRRLSSEYVDLVQLHEALEGWEGRLETLATLVTEGKARTVGLCNATHRQLERALAIAPLTSYQGGYNLFDRDVEQRELPLCRARGVAFLAYRPLAAGLLARTYAAPPEFAGDDHRRRLYWFRGREFERRRTVIARLGPIAQRQGVPLAALALGWVLSRPGVSIVLAGARDARQVDEQLAIVDRPLDPATLAEIDAAVHDVFRPPPRASATALVEARGWGERERFIVERLDGGRTPEAIAAEWTDRGGTAMIGAQVKVFVDELENRGLLESGSGEKGEGSS